MKQKTIKKISVFALITLLILSAIASFTIAGTTSDDVSVDDYNIDYSYDLTEAVAGERFDLTITLTNKDTIDKENIKFSWDLDDPFDIDNDDEEWDIKILGAGANVSKTFRIDIDEEADSDEYKLNFNLEDSKDDWDDYVEVEVDSDKADLIIANIQSSPLTLTPGTENIKLTVKLENQGEQSAKFIKTRLILPDGFTPSDSYSDSYSVGTIAGESQQEAIFYINIDENVKTNDYIGQIKIDYKENNNDKTKTLEINLPVHGNSQFSIDSVSSESKIMPKQTSKIKVKITNTGDKKAEETSVKVFEKSDYPFSFTEKTYYIGTLEPGESGTAVFELTVDTDATPNNYIIETQIRTVNDGTVLVNEKSINIKISKYERTALDYLKIIGIIILVILAIIIFFVYKAKQKRKQALISAKKLESERILYPSSKKKI
ncbi:MAG: CARDB domain-containing protein [Candidatus Pacearchaeota archaeon]